MVFTLGEQARALSTNLYGRSDMLANVDAVLVAMLVEVAAAIPAPNEVIKIAMRTTIWASGKDPVKAREFAAELVRVYVGR